MGKSVETAKTGFAQQADDVRGRINSVLAERGITENSMAAGDSATQSRLNNQLSHNGRITLDTVLRILAVRPDISADWLLRGEGERQRSATAITGANSVTGQSATVIGQQVMLSEEFVKGLLAEKDKQISERDKQINQLIQIIAK